MERVWRITMLHRWTRLIRRNASTTPLQSGPAIDIPSFPSHSRPAPAAPPKIEVMGTAPSFEALKEHEDWGDDTELVDEGEARIFVTEPALNQLVKIASRESTWNPEKPHVALRLSVESGGCHGYQYDMKLEEQDPNVDDYVFNVKGADGKPAVPVVIDLISLGLLKGSTLHFATELIGSAFGIKDNPQAKESGSCGCGISWEAK
ncbi:hypothetical protein QFC20_001313 [Naganishia adeliensis]|uniref:Uncharacterized protein n=1 Tax=Naganishia adeliensis TaxID=92952 RepID=A0ACC2WT45_9TREE|nr:hypothetical protein QFC20_001313 [Naganishia adeliensis]